MSLLGRLTAQAKGWVSDVRHILGWQDTRRLENRPEEQSLDAAQPSAPRPVPSAPPLRFTPPQAPPPFSPPAPSSNFPSWAGARLRYSGRFANALASISLNCEALIRERALARIAARAGREKAELRAALAAHSADRLLQLAASPGEVGMNRLLQDLGVPPSAASWRK